MDRLRPRLNTLLGNQKLAVLQAAMQAAPPVEGVSCHDLTLTFDNGVSARAWFIEQPRHAPVVLYCHAHGNNYAIGRDELLHGRPALLSPYGPALARAGFSAFCLEMPCFGARGDMKETAEAKAALWRGQPLFGRMLAELSAALRWLVSRPGTGPVATLGLSMGATHAFWLAALEPGIAAAAHICAFADLETLIQTGAHDLHGPYLTVPGLLPMARTGEIAGLIAPRPQLVCGGLQDPLTPPAALERGLADLHAAYLAHPDRLRTVIAPDQGHVESPDMRNAVMEFLAEVLR